MEKIKNRIKCGLEKRGMMQSELCEITGIPKSAISQYISGKFEPKQTRIYLIAKALDVSEAWLMGADVPMEKIQNDKCLKNVIQYDPSDMVQIPILGSVAAGLACQCDDNIIGYELVQRSSITSGEDYVFLKVKGDSMEPLLMEDDLVLVKCVDSVDSGDYAVMIVDGEDGLIKQVKYDKHSVTLVSANPYYPPRVFKGDEELSRLRVFGKVVESKRKF